MRAKKGEPAQKAKKQKPAQKAEKNRPAPTVRRSRPAPDSTPDAEGNITVSVSLLEAQIGANPIIEEIRRNGRALLNLRLNEREREFILQHPVTSVVGAFAALGAFVASAVAFFGEPLTDSRRDAVRHALFAAHLFFVLDAETAQTILDNHEFGRNDPFDNENNAAGRAIGLRIRAAGLPAAVIFGEVFAAAEDGRLQFPGSPPRPTPPAQPPAPQPPPAQPPATPPEPGGRDIDDRRPPRPVEPVVVEPVGPQPLDIEPIEPGDSVEPGEPLDVEPIEPGERIPPILLNLRRRASAKKGRKSQKKVGKKSAGKGYKSSKAKAVGKKPSGKKKRR